MNSELEVRWKLLTQTRDAFLAVVSSWSEDQKHAQPEESWSASQVLEHILASEVGTLGYMKKKTSSGWENMEVTAQEHREKSNALNTRLASPENYKAPSILQEPTNNFPFQQLIQQWKSTQNEMEDFIMTIDEKNYDKLIFRQPMAGMLNILQTLEFLQKHTEHHIPQLHRIKESQGF